jgi:hypothetical protein
LRIDYVNTFARLGSVVGAAHDGAVVATGASAGQPG